MPPVPNTPISGAPGVDASRSDGKLMRSSGAPSPAKGRSVSFFRKRGEMRGLARFRPLQDFPVQGNLNGFFRHVAEQGDDALEVFGIRVDVHGRLVLPFFNESQDIGIVHVLVQVVGYIAGFRAAFFHQFPGGSDELVRGSGFDGAFGGDFDHGCR